MSASAKCSCGRPLGHTGRHVGGPFKKGGRFTDPKLLTIARAVITEQHDTIARLKREIADRQDAILTAHSALPALVAFADALELPALPAPSADPEIRDAPEQGDAGRSASSRVTALPTPEKPEPSPPPVIPASPASGEPVHVLRCSMCRRFLPEAQFMQGSKTCTRCRAAHAKPALAAAKPPPLPKPPPAETATPEDFEPVEATYDLVAAWSVTRGIAFISWDDLPRVNRKREELGLPGFKRKLGAGRPFALGRGVSGARA